MPERASDRSPNQHKHGNFAAFIETRFQHIPPLERPAWQQSVFRLFPNQLPKSENTIVGSIDDRTSTAHNSIVENYIRN
jgi:hypothetical protein